MNDMKRAALVAIMMATMALVGAGTASATTLEVGSVTQNQAVALTLSVASGETFAFKDTAGNTEKTCTTSHIAGQTANPYTGTYVTGSFTQLSFSNCMRNYTIHDPGKFEIHWTSKTNGTVYSEEMRVTEEVRYFGTSFYLNCETDATTHLGTLTGAASGHATLHVNAIIDCGPLLPSSNWEATYTVTSPSGLGISS